jgi:hypothetical protein
MDISRIGEDSAPGLSLRCRSWLYDGACHSADDVAILSPFGPSPCAIFSNTTGLNPDELSDV